MFIPKPLGPHRWQLFNIRVDPGETKDLASENPEKLKEMLEHWVLYVAETGLVDITDDFEAHYKKLPL